MRRHKMALVLGLLALTAATAACGDEAGAGVASVTDPTASPTTGPDTVPTDPLEAMIAYADCMRENGVSQMPDPQQRGDEIDDGLGEADIDRDSPEFQAAHEACHHLRAALEPGGATFQQNWGKLLEHAQCMRDHGVAEYPDPQQEGDGMGQFLPQVVAEDPAYDAAVEACKHLAPSLYEDQ